MRQGSAGRYLTWLLIAGIAALAVATLLAECARLGWLPELASHFRPQYVAALLVAVAMAAALGRRRLAAAALLVMVPNLWAASPYLLPWVVPGRAASPGAGELSLVSLNLLYSNEDRRRVHAYLAAANPDVLVLEELTPEWLHALRPVLERYPYSVAADQVGPWGLGLFSRVPLRDTRTTDLGVRGSFNVITTLDLAGGPVRLAAVHLSSPTSALKARYRNAQLEQLARLLGSVGGAMPRLVLGDLNATPFSPYLRDLLQRTGMQDARRPQGLLGTWPRWMPLLQIPIDHCIADPAAGITSVTRGPAVGSDHYPLEVRMRASR